MNGIPVLVYFILSLLPLLSGKILIQYVVLTTDVLLFHAHGDAHGILTTGENEQTHNGGWGGGTEPLGTPMDFSPEMVEHTVMSCPKRCVRVLNTALLYPPPPAKQKRHCRTMFISSD